MVKCNCGCGGSLMELSSMEKLNVCSTLITYLKVMVIRRASYYRQHHHIANISLSSLLSSAYAKPLIELTIVKMGQLLAAISMKEFTGV